MVQFALFFIRLFKAPIQWLGVDYPQFEVLIRTKLIIDFRSSPTGLQTAGGKKRTFAYQLFTYAALGLLFGITAFSVGDLVLSLTIFFTVVLVSLTMTLLSEFTSVLFDQRDNYILLPRPISNRALLLLRLVHIQFYMGSIALALALGTGIIIAIKYNILTVIIFFIGVGLTTWMALISTTFIYLLISKIVKGERFKDLLSYAQIGIAIIFFGGYQLMPKLMDASVLKNVTMSVNWWTYLFPPAWMAALVKLSLFNGISTPYLLIASLAIIVPVMGALFLVRSMSKGFGNILADGQSESISLQSTQSRYAEITGRIDSLFCVSETEKAAWKFAVATVKRDRKFKQSVYPFFGIMIIFALGILIPNLTNTAVALHENNEFTKYLFIVIFGFSGNAAVMQLPYTDTPEAAWIYKSLPFKQYGHLMTGAIKALLVRFCIPMYLLVIIPSLLLWGPSVFPQIILSSLCNVFIILMLPIFQKNGLPFTQPREMQQKGTNSLIAIFGMVLMFMMAGLLYISTFLPAGASFLISILISGIIILIFRHIRKSWIYA
jgi:ABC-2 type transport system permease protein